MCLQSLLCVSLSRLARVVFIMGWQSEWTLNTVLLAILVRVHHEHLAHSAHAEHFSLGCRHVICHCVDWGLLNLLDYR